MYVYRPIRTVYIDLYKGVEHCTFGPPHVNCYNQVNATNKNDNIIIYDDDRQDYNDDGNNDDGDSDVYCIPP